MIDSAQQPKEYPDARYTAYPAIPVETIPNGPVWKSPRFWFIGLASLCSVLVREDFQSLPWNQIVGQIGILWGTGAWGTGQWDRTVDKFSK